MSTSAISKRYAKALVSLGSGQNKVEDFGQELSLREVAVFAGDLFDSLLDCRISSVSTVRSS